MSKWFSSFY